MRSITTINIALQAGKKIGDLVKHRKSQEQDNKSTVYKIPCKGCEKSYYGETHRGTNIRIREHKRDMKYGREQNAMETHRTMTGHLPEWEEVEELSTTRRKRKIIEAASITTEPSINIK